MYSTQLSPSRWLQSWRPLPAVVNRSCCISSPNATYSHAVRALKQSAAGQLNTDTVLQNNVLQQGRHHDRRHCNPWTRLVSSSSSPVAAASGDTSHSSKSSSSIASSSRATTTSSSSGSIAHTVQTPDKPLRVERLLANLGYGKRKECTVMIKRKQLLYAATGTPAKVGEKAFAGDLLLDGEALDPPPPLNIILHKPVGYVVTSPDDENVMDPKVYDLLPYRFGRRRPFLSCIGRLDKETSGLLLLTDDGKLLHSIQSPARGIWKLYRAELNSTLEGREAATATKQFASGRLQLHGDRTALLPAGLRMLGPTTAEVAICEGRYHQIRRMFAAVGREVVGLHRHTIGGLRLLDSSQAAGEGDNHNGGSTAVLTEGSWRIVSTDELKAALSGPDLLDQILQQRY